MNEMGLNKARRKTAHSMVDAIIDGQGIHNGMPITGTSVAYTFIWCLSENKDYKIAPHEADFQAAVRECSTEGSRAKFQSESPIGNTIEMRSDFCGCDGALCAALVVMDGKHYPQTGLKSWMLKAKWLEVTDEESDG